MLKKSIIGTLMLLTMLLIISSCKKEEQNDADSTVETANQEETTTSSATGGSTTNGSATEPVVKHQIITEGDNETESTYEALNAALNEGNIEISDYNTTLMQLAIEPTELSGNQDIVMRADEHLDLSSAAQWMVNNYDELDEKGKALVDKMSAIEWPEDATSSISLPFSLTVHAEDNEPLYPKKIMDRAYLTHPLVDVELDETLELNIQNIYLENHDLLGLPVDILQSKYKIVITTYPMIDAIASYSFLRYIPDLDGITETFFIHLNSTADYDTLKGSLCHELFHAYQYEMGYMRESKLENFLMESTAIWAVKHLDGDLEYPNLFDDPIYESLLFMDEDILTPEEMKSWYQLPYMMVDQYGNSDFVKNYLNNGLSSTSMVEALAFAVDTEEELHNMMARFGQVLFADVANSSLDIPLEAPYFSGSIEESIYEIESIEEISEKPELTAMSERILNAPGYYPVMISLEDNPNAIIDILSNLSAEENHKHTGLTVFIEEEETWRLALSGEYDSFATHFDLKGTPASNLMLLFFSYNTEEVTHKYSLDVQNRIIGEGMIHVEITKTKNYHEDDSGVINDTANFTLDITENIELLVMESSSNEEDAIVSLILGDIYYVKDFQAILSGNALIEHIEGDSRKYNYNGTYTYKDGDVSSDQLPNNILSFDMDTLFGGTGTPGGTSGNLLDGLTDGLDLGGVDLSGIDGLDGLLDEVTEAQEEAKDELAGLGDMGSIADIFFADRNRLQRMKEIIDSGTFHIYPTMPPGLVSDTWINYTLLKKERDSDGKLVSSNESGETQITFEPLPIWFRNPNYDPDAITSALDSLPKDPEAFMSEFDDMSDIMDQMMVINGSLDESNLYHAFNNGPYTFELSEVSNSKEGTQTQELLLDDNSFSATIKAHYIYLDDIEYEVEIDMDYTFD